MSRKQPTPWMNPHPSARAAALCLLGASLIIPLFSVAVARAAIWVPLEGVHAQEAPPRIDVIHSDFNKIQIQIQLEGFSWETMESKQGAFARLLLPGEGGSSDIGRPELPVIRRLIEIPYGATCDLQVSSFQSQELLLDDFGIRDRLLPKQPHVPKVPGAAEKVSFELDETAYQRTGFGEIPVASLSNEGYLRGHRLVMLEVFPFDYSPADGRLRIHRDIQLQINLTGADVEKGRAMQSRLADRQTQRLARRLFLNYGASDDPDLVHLPLGLLIITTPQFSALPLLNDFILWKEQKGYHTFLATTQETGSRAAEIKAYIQNAYDHWPIPPNFVLLIGDVDVIPVWQSSTPGNPSSDLYYSTLEGHDCFPDVGIGRFSISNAAELTNIINKTLNYEQGLWSGHDWEKQAVFLASNDNWWITEATHDSVIAQHLEPDGYRSTKLYCHAYGATSRQVSTSINQGRSLAIYAGHGYFFCWLDGPLFLSRDVAGLSNNYYPFVGSFACDTGQFMRVGECFGETWIRSPHGAIAFWGAAATSYWIPDDILERSMFEGFFAERLPLEDENLTWLAGMTTYAKFSFWRHEGGGTSGLYYWELYNLLGDPSVDIWTDAPQNLTVTFPATIHIGQTSLQVGVSGYPDWAMVNIYSDAEELQFAGYVVNGTVIFNLGTGFTVPGTLHLWVTGHDCRPYHGTAAIVEAGVSGLGAKVDAGVGFGESGLPKTFGVTASPNPFNPSTAIRFELPQAAFVRVQVYDLAGRQVAALANDWRDAGFHEVQFDGSQLASGIYLCRMEAGDFTAVQKLLLQK